MEKLKEIGIWIKDWIWEAPKRFVAGAIAGGFFMWWF